MGKGSFMQQLTRWREEGRISALDARFGSFLAERSGNETLGLLGAVASHLRSQGHVCLDPRLPPEDLPGLDLQSAWAAIQTLDSLWLGRGSDHWHPLVLDEGRLYLGRLHRAECRIAERILAWSRMPNRPAPDREDMERLFPEPDPGSLQQALAAVVAMLRPCTLITGGPGTGKTTTVLRILALQLRQRPELAIRLLAPTGKAAARLTESLQQGRSRLRLPGFDPARIPDRVSTVHRFLGLGHGRPRYHRHRPAPVDLVVLDEASMIDLETMQRLLDALPEHAGLILLGDPDQLASVEAGSVLADLVAPARDAAFTRATRETIAAAGLPVEHLEDGDALDDGLVRLTHSHRFPSDRGIGKLAAAVRHGDAEWSCLQEIARSNPEIELLEWRGDKLPSDAFDGFLEALDSARHADVEAALEALADARVLCALRRGPAGVEILNATLAERLGRADDRHAHGRPILVTRNAAVLGVYNGDMGVLWESAERTNHGRPRLHACFLSESGNLRRLPLPELPEHEPAYAITVHKSQGSEYDRILLVLPPEPHPLVTRELIYTALTRARNSVRILATPASWNEGVTRRTQRASGLADRLECLLPDG